MAKRIKVQIKNVLQGLNEGIDETVAKAAFASFATIVIASPVKTGTFRGNWQVSLNQPIKTVLETTDKSGAKTIANADTFFANYTVGIASGGPNKIVFSNNMQYAKRLNEGHSKKARPAGFVQRALLAGLKNLGATGRFFK